MAEFLPFNTREATSVTSVLLSYTPNHSENVCTLTKERNHFPGCIFSLREIQFQKVEFTPLGVNSFRLE